MQRNCFSLILLSLIILLAACQPEEKKNQIDFSDMFENIADNIIVPRYSEFYQSLESLELSLNAIDVETEQGIAFAQEQFNQCYMAWQKVSAFEFGPAAEYSALLRSNCNTFPCNADKVALNILSQDYNLESASNYEAKGLPALDYLLYGDGDLSVAGLSYAKDCVQDMKQRLASVITAWDSYRDQFVDKEGTGQNSSLSLFFNQFLYDYEQVKRNKFGLPAGFATQYGIPISKDETMVEALYSARSFELLSANLQALHDLFMGIGEDGVSRVSLYDKLQEGKAMSTVVDGDLAEAIDNQFQVCIEGLNNFDANLYEEIFSANPELEGMYADLQKMIPMLKNDMRSYLSVSVSISDADGD